MRTKLIPELEKFFEDLRAIAVSGSVSMDIQVCRTARVDINVLENASLTQGCFVILHGAE